MKNTVLLFFLFLSTAIFCQKQFTTGVYVEGNAFFPKANVGEFNSPINLSGGGGLFVSKSLNTRFSVSLQGGYRYKENSVTIYTIGGTSPGGGYEQGSGYGYELYPTSSSVEEQFKLHYLVLPLKLQYHFKSKLFIESGIETSLLVSFKRRIEKPEFNWVLGLGYQFNHFSTSLNYVEGFNDHIMSKTNNGITKGIVFQNRMLVLSVSYPIF